MTFVDKDGVEKRPYMIHRALLGSIERFFGVLMENYAGAFPPWLSPDQIAIIPVGDMAYDYSKALADTLKKEGFRVALDLSDDRMNAKIRKAQKQKTPYMLIIGEKEMAGNLVSIRYRNGKQANLIPTADFIKEVHSAIDNKEQI